MGTISIIETLKDRKIKNPAIISRIDKKSFDIKNPTPFAIKYNAINIAKDSGIMLKNAKIQNKIPDKISNIPSILTIMFL